MGRRDHRGVCGESAWKETKSNGSLLVFGSAHWASKRVRQDHKSKLSMPRESEEVTVSHTVSLSEAHVLCSAWRLGKVSEVSRALQLHFLALCAFFECGLLASGPQDVLRGRSRYMSCLRFLEKSTKTLTNFQARKICHAGWESLEGTSVDSGTGLMLLQLDSREQSPWLCGREVLLR